MRFSSQTIDDRAKQKSLSRRFVVLPFHVAKGFHPDVMVPEILAVVTPLPISFPDVFGELRRRVAVPKTRSSCLALWFSPGVRAHVTQRDEV